MTGFIIIATLIALVASVVVIQSRQPQRTPPQRTQRHLRRLKHQRRRYYQRRMRTMEQRYLVLLAFVIQWQYRQQSA